MNRLTKSYNGYYVDGIRIENEIFNDELYEYQIINRGIEIENIMSWIYNSTYTKDRDAMKEDLKSLMNMNDEYIFGSINTNDYIDQYDKDYDLHCDNILKLNYELGLK